MLVILFGLLTMYTLPDTIELGSEILVPSPPPTTLRLPTPAPTDDEYSGIEYGTEALETPQATATGSYTPHSLPSASSGVLGTTTREKAQIVRIVDGDTVELADGRKLRYIGIDTPETVKPGTALECFGKEASEKNKELVLGKYVELEKDVSETDRYGRLLRLVYVDGVFVNDYLVRNGFAYASSYPPDVKYSQQLKDAQRDAQQKARGMWSAGCKI